MKLAASEKKRPAVSEKRRSMLKAGLAMPVVASGAAAAVTSGCATVARRTDDATALSAVEAVRRITDGSLSAENYASQLLARYESTRVINAVTWINKQQVLESARKVDVMRAKGQKLGPLAGLPVAIKDNIDTVGFPTTGGTPSLKVNLPKQNAVLVDVLFNNGAYLFGKTNCMNWPKAPLPATWVTAPRAIRSTRSGSRADRAADRQRRWRRALCRLRSAPTLRVPHAFRPRCAG
jgi:hypothetical protein